MVLDAIRHQDFLKQQRKDPIIKELLKPGDRIVLCAHCGLAFLEGSWEAVKGRRFGHGTDTLPDIEIGPEPTRFGRQQPPTPPPAQARTNGNGTTTAAPPNRDLRAAREPRTETPGDSVENNVRAADEPRDGAGPLRLREIPFQLREIPFSLRQICEL